MIEHLNITNLIMKRDDFKTLPDAIQMALRLYARATNLISNGFIHEGEEFEKQAFEVLKESGGQLHSHAVGAMSPHVDSQVDEPYIPRDSLEMD